MAAGRKRTIATGQALDSKLQLVRAEARKDPDRFAQKYLRVKPKMGPPIPFKHNYTQECIARASEEMLRENLPVRLFVLKSRQVGSTTGLLAHGFAKAWATDDYEGVLVAQLDETAKTLLERVKFWHADMGSRINEETRQRLQLILSKDSRHSIGFADTRSQLYVVSAKNKDAARGNTKQWGHLTEFSYYPNPMLILKEFSQICHYLPGTEMYIDTTGKGFNSPAHAFWDECVKLAGEGNIVVDGFSMSTFRPLFVKWQKDPECIYRFSSDRDRDMLMGMAFEYQPKLKDRMEEHNLSPGNIIYSWQSLLHSLHGDWEEYLQEHPCTADEAWRLKGKSFFGSENLNVIKRFIPQYDEQARYFLYDGMKSSPDQMFDSFGELMEVPAKEIAIDDDRPYFILWKRPSPNGDYVISGDSALGVEGGNFCSSFVLDKRTFEMCLEFHGRIRPDQHAKVMESLGNIYNYALLAPEYNNHGHVVVDNLRRNYGNIYREQVDDEYGNKERRKLGWSTNYTTRPQILSLAKRVIEDLAKGQTSETFFIKSHGLMKELASFQLNDDERAESVSGTFDDRVLAWSIALKVIVNVTLGTSDDALENYKKKGERVVKPTDLSEYQQDPMDVLDNLTNSRPQIWGGKDSKIWAQWRNLNGWT